MTMRNFLSLGLLVFLVSAFTNPDLKDNEGLEGIAGKKVVKVPGYILNKNGKKLEGKITPGSITDNELKITFFNRSGQKKTYKPKDIQGYGYEAEVEDDLGLGDVEWVHYESAKADYPPKPFASKDVFMQRESEGTISLFCYYIEVRNNPKNPFRYVYYLKDQDGKLNKIEKDDFKKVSKTLFKDYTAMNNRIGRKDFLYKNLDRMVRDYNYWVANQHDAGEYRVAMKQ